MSDDGDEMSAASRGSGANHSAFPNSWIPVSERTPAPHEVVLYFANEPHRFTGVQIGHLYDGTWQGRWLYPTTGAGEIKFDGPCFHERYVTHWMPLPALPTDTK